MTDPKKDGASSNQIHDGVVLHVLLVEELAVEPHCEVVDLVLGQENIALMKKRKNAYGMNRHFQDTWAIKLG